MKITYIKMILRILLFLPLLGHAIIVHTDENDLDVTGYHLTIEPIIDKQYISGTVIINFQINSSLESVVFNSGNLNIDNVVGNNVLGFEKIGKDLKIGLSKRTNMENEIIIQYHGNPKRGLVFDLERNQAYTAYFTSEWMICNDSPGDKALFKLDLVISSDKTCTASGELIAKVSKNNKTHYSYQQDYESPTYTYGFVIGKFNKVETDYKDVLLNYLGRNYSMDQLEIIFRETPSIMSFFEQKSGVEYYQSAYTQVLIGSHYQEMSGYSILKGGYGNLVLKDHTETNLISHELAHQWWGNRITCNDWNHFWLNEAMATFMSAAYNEHRFGKEKYRSDINSYYEVYRKVKERGKDKALVFKDWANPTDDDRNIVYFKGAYVIHLLKEEMGDERFWNAIKFYSTKYFGESVKTADFQKALEESSGIDLERFFNKWVYK